MTLLFGNFAYLNVVCKYCADNGGSEFLGGKIQCGKEEHVKAKAGKSRSTKWWLLLIESSSLYKNLIIVYVSFFSYTVAFPIQ